MKPSFNRSLAAVVALSSSAFAAQLFKDSTGTDLNTLANWSTVNGATTPDPTSFTTSDQLRFNENTAASGTFTMDLSAALSVGNLTVDSGTLGGGSATGNFVINSANISTLTLNSGGNPSYTTSGIVLNSASGGTLTINSKIALGANPVRFTTSRALTVNGDIALGANTLEFNTAGSTTTLAGVISGTGGLNKAQGGATLALTNTANDFGGQVTLVGGTTNITKLAIIGNNSSLGTGNVASSIILNGAVLTYTGAGGDTTERAIDMRAGAVINNNSATGTITFTAANVTQGGTASARILTLGGSNGGDNTFNSILGNSGISANISTLQKNGTGKWIVTGTQAYTGATIINQGILAVSGSTVLGGATGSAADTGNIVFGSGNTNGALQFETVANLGAADQIRFRNTTGPAAGQGGALVYTGTTDQTLSKTLQCDSSVGIRIESNSVGGSLTLNGTFSQTNRPLFLGGTGTGNNTLATGFSGTGSITKRDSGKWILSATNNYTGATSITGGTLVIGASGSLGATAVTVGGAGATGTPTLGGGGTIGGATTIAAAGGGVVGTHSVGVAGVSNGVGTQTFSSTLNYGTGSIFEWNFQAIGTSDIGVVSNAATGTYDQVVANGALSGSGAEFKIVLGGNAFSDAFWDSNKRWTNVFSGAGAGSWASIFSSITGDSITWNTGLSRGEVGTVGPGGTGGYFTASGSSLNWTAVPEPTTTLAGLLLGAGLLRRRRSA